MWFEARKHEKNIRGMMIDSRKRAERRQAFYEKTRKDPAEFMQVHGAKSRIYMDANICKAADEQGGVRPWQGDSKILIDRFDARAYLDFIPEFKQATDEEVSDDEEERRCCYERYRILIRNEFEKVSEDKFLKQIFLEERFGASASGSSAHSLAKAEREQKKLLASKKAMIGFDYDCNEGVGARKSKKEESSDESEVESEPEFDAPIDARILTPEQCRDLNKLGAKFKMKVGDFVEYMYEDREQQDQLSELKKVEEAKASLSGKNSRRERQILKQKRLMLMGKGMDYTKPRPTGATGDDLTVASRSSSESRSPSPAKGTEGRVEYIRTFGGEPDSEPEPEPMIVQGPELPTNEQRKLLELRRRRSRSSDIRDRNKRSSSRSRRRRSRSRSRSYSSSRRRRSNSRHRRKSRSTSRSKRKSSSRTRDRKRSTSRNRRRSRSRSRRRTRSRTGSRNRSRSNRKQRSRSRSPSNNKSRRDSSKSSERGDSRKIGSLARRQSNSSSSERKNSKSRSTSPSRGKRLQNDNHSPMLTHLSPRVRGLVKNETDKSDSELSALSLGSDLSEEERERREVENTRRRIKRARGHRNGASLKRNDRDSINEASNKTAKSLSLRERLALQTQKALKKTYIKDKEEEKERRREMEREERERDLELRELSTLQRRRERDKRHREIDDRVVRDKSHEKKRSRSKSREKRRTRERSGSWE